MVMAATVRHPGFTSPTVASFSLFSFLSEQVGFQLNFHVIRGIDTRKTGISSIYGYR